MNVTKIQVNVKDYKVTTKPTWCPGCGNYGIISALQKALAELDIPPYKVNFASGIGCSSKIVHYVETYGAHTIHGRALPFAQGARIANHHNIVIAAGGDGDGYGIGGGHFLNALRRNINMTYIVHDNQVYGLTKGQASPTSMMGMKTKTTPRGVIDKPFNPIPVAISSGATFVARGAAFDTNGLREIFKQAILHEGFAFIDVLQHCVIFNKLNTIQWYKDHVKYIGKDIEHDPTDKKKALLLGSEYDDFIPLGIIYQVKEPTLEDHFPQLQKGPLVDHDISHIDITPLLEERI